MTLVVVVLLLPSTCPTSGAAPVRGAVMPYCWCLVCGWGVRDVVSLKAGRWINGHPGNFI